MYAEILNNSKNIHNNMIIFVYNEEWLVCTRMFKKEFEEDSDVTSTLSMLILLAQNYHLLVNSFIKLNLSSSNYCLNIHVIHTSHSLLSRKIIISL